MVEWAPGVTPKPDTVTLGRHVEQLVEVRSPEPEEGSKTVGTPGTSLVVQGLQLHTANTGGPGSIPGQGTKIAHAVGCGQKIKKIR